MKLTSILFRRNATVYLFFCPRSIFYLVCCVKVVINKLPVTGVKTLLFKIKVKAGKNQQKVQSQQKCQIY